MYMYIYIYIYIHIHTLVYPRLFIAASLSRDLGIRRP